MPPMWFSPVRPQRAASRLVPLLSLPVLWLVVLWLPVFWGCGPAAPPASSPRPVAGHDTEHDHDHGHEHAPGHRDAATASFSDGVRELESLGRDLAAKLAEDAGDAADEVVHGIGHLLEEIRARAKAEGLADSAAAHLDELEECFGKVDEAFHAGDAQVSPRDVLESVKDRLAAAFKALTEATR
ncbi:MAG: hypothetical protein ACKO4T_02920 [Planctomycetaceae bacterium]